MYKIRFAKDPITGELVLTIYKKKFGSIYVAQPVKLVFKERVPHAQTPHETLRFSDMDGEHFMFAMAKEIGNTVKMESVTFRPIYIRPFDFDLRMFTL